ncbi:MAG: hypothetical protein KBS91_04180 [Firmicutes bacterium]|nr:hypothetical protein [Candidatus Caballimonas caccae]
MLMKVRIGYNERYNCYHTELFEVMDRVPKIGTPFDDMTMEEDGEFSVVDSVTEITPDMDNRDEVFNYDLYKVVVRVYRDYGDEVEANNENYYYAVEKNNDEGED